jgi:RND family efflux transporter MFP subunit
VQNIDLDKLRIKRSPLMPVNTGNSRRKWMAGAAVVAVLALWLALRPGTADVETTVAVTAFPSQAYSLLNATGYVVAQRKASVASKGTGRLEWLGVVEGSRVKKDEVIARLESADVEAQLGNARANVQVATAQVNTAMAELADGELALSRNMELRPKGMISQAALDETKSRVVRARAGVASARASLAAAEATARYAAVGVESTRIRAPFDGVILSKTANVGDVVTALASAADSKGAVVVMADMTTLEVEADVSEASIASIKVGQPCEIQLDAIPEKRFRGVVSRIVPTVDRAKATVMTKIRFVDNDPCILPEMSAKASFLSQDITPEMQKPTLAVSPDTVRTRDGKSSVFVVRDGIVHAVAVTTGQKIGEVVEVKGDIKAGDVLVRNPSPSLDNGDRVNAKQAG